MGKLRLTPGRVLGGVAFLLLIYIIATLQNDSSSGTLSTNLQEAGRVGPTQGLMVVYLLFVAIAVRGVELSEQFNQFMMIVVLSGAAIMLVAIGLFVRFHPSNRRNK